MMKWRASEWVGGVGEVAYNGVGFHLGGRAILLTSPSIEDFGKKRPPVIRYEETMSHFLRMLQKGGQTLTCRGIL